MTIVLLLMTVIGCSDSRRRKAAQVAKGPAAAKKGAPEAEKKAEPEPEKKAEPEAEKKADLEPVKPPKDGDKGKNGQAPKPAKMREATGRGENLDIAKKDVLKDAMTQIANMMQKEGLRTFVVTEDFVKNQVLAFPGRPGDDVKVKLDEAEHIFKAWIVGFRTDTDWWNDIVRRDQEKQRELRAEDRQSATSRVMLGLSVLLLAGVGYNRLDEYTQRRYTIWLRAAGVSVAATAVAAWFWVVSSH